MSATITAGYPHVTVDDQGVARITGTGLKIIQLVLAKQAWHLSPEDMVESFPPLTLAQAYSALAYYYDHQAEFDLKIQQDREYAEQMRSQLDDGQLKAKLLARVAARTPT